MRRHYVFHRGLQLLRSERDEPSERDHEEYGRYMSDIRYLDSQSGCRVGEAGMAVLVAPSRRVCHVGVSKNRVKIRITDMTRYGTFVFNGLIAPVCFPPPPAVHLPHEPALEETGEVPAAAAQGRAGYDVVPSQEE